jgi:hypothetical protein
LNAYLVHLTVKKKIVAFSAGDLASVLSLLCLSPCHLSFPLPLLRPSLSSAAQAVATAHWHRFFFKSLQADYCCAIIHTLPTSLFIKLVDGFFFQFHFPFSSNQCRQVTVATPLPLTCLLAIIPLVVQGRAATSPTLLTTQPIGPTSSSRCHQPPQLAFTTKPFTAASLDT